MDYAQRLCEMKERLTEYKNNPLELSIKPTKKEIENFFEELRNRNTTLMDIMLKDIELDDDYEEDYGLESKSFIGERHRWQDGMLNTYVDAFKTDCVSMRLVSLAEMLACTDSDVDWNLDELVNFHLSNYIDEEWFDQSALEYLDDEDVIYR